LRDKEPTLITKIFQWMIVLTFAWFAAPYAWRILRAAIWLLVVVWTGLAEAHI